MKGVMSGAPNVRKAEVLEGIGRETAHETSLLLVILFACVYTESSDMANCKLDVLPIKRSNLFYLKGSSFAFILKHKILSPAHQT